MRSSRVTSIKDFLKNVDIEVNAFISEQSGVHGCRHFDEQVLLIYFNTVYQVNNWRNILTSISFNYHFNACGVS